MTVNVARRGQAIDSKTVNILGIRGVPAAHGGFETFVQVFAPWLVLRGWKVNVYCQASEGMADGAIDRWCGVNRIHFHSRSSGPASTIEFDLRCVRHVLGQPGIDLVLGYNTAIFTILQRLRGRRVIMNMDGIEWKRAKWSTGVKVWFFVNEILGANLAHMPIADHPEIARHVAARSMRKPVMIPYGSPVIDEADPRLIAPFGIEPDRYFISIARIEPENSIMELVRSAAALPEGFRAVFLGRFDPKNAYHRDVQSNASNKVLFPGAIYDPSIVGALRFHTRAYLHGHQVGGTNPSLVEALGAGNAVLAHDNRFNRWTAGAEQFFFSDEASCRAAMAEIFADREQLARARAAARARHSEAFQWENILVDYERVLWDQVHRAR